MPDDCPPDAAEVPDEPGGPDALAAEAPTLPPPIEPDTKDWTWVLGERCPDCGFDAASVEPSTTGTQLRALAARFADLLAAPTARIRPDDRQWSALEYGCHVRDVFRLYETRLRLMLDEDDPLFANWDQDLTAVEEGYTRQDPALVATELLAAADGAAAAFDAVEGDQWSRVGRRSDGASFTVDSFTRYFLHDPVHHVWDVERGNERLGG